MIEHIILASILAGAGIINFIITNKYIKEMKKWFGIIKAVYATVLRPLVAEKVQDSESEIDDFVLSLCDKLFDYGD